MKTYYVYILANKKNGRLYTGITNNIFRRVWEHRVNYNWGCYTSRFNIKRLVYLETHKYVLNAIKREKLVKKWKRQWKIDMIEVNNKNWMDLARDWY